MYGAWPRALRLSWPVAAVLLSSYFLSYLVPATDTRVAAFHGLGVVHLPQGAMTLTKTDGHRIARDIDPWYLINNGYGGYLVLASPGDYRMSEICIQGFTVLGPQKVVDIHVALGATIGRPRSLPPLTSPSLLTLR